jgi:hypothetical protein
VELPNKLVAGEVVPLDSGRFSPSDHRQSMRRRLTVPMHPTATKTVVCARFPTGARTRAAANALAGVIPASCRPPLTWTDYWGPPCH